MKNHIKYQLLAFLPIMLLFIPYSFKIFGTEYLVILILANSLVYRPILDFYRFKAINSEFKIDSVLKYIFHTRYVNYHKLLFDK